MGEHLWREIKETEGEIEIPQSVVTLIDNDLICSHFNKSMKNGEEEYANGRFETSKKHCIDVARITEVACEQLDIDGDPKRILVTSALLHDIGKEKIPLEILVKPECLNKDEVMRMERHVLESWLECQRLSDNIEDPDRAKEMREVIAEIVFRHHSWGTGRPYPSVEQFHIHPEFDTQIIQASQVISVIDIYDSLTSTRVYKPGMELEETKGILLAKFPVEDFSENPNIQKLIDFLTQENK